MPWLRKPQPTLVLLTTLLLEGELEKSHLVDVEDVTNRGPLNLSELSRLKAPSGSEASRQRKSEASRQNFRRVTMDRKPVVGQGPMFEGGQMPLLALRSEALLILSRLVVAVNGQIWMIEENAVISPKLQHWYNSAGSRSRENPSRRSNKLLPSGPMH